MVPLAGIRPTTPTGAPDYVSDFLKAHAPSDINVNPFEGIGAVLRGLRSPQEGGLAGPIGGIGRGVFGTLNPKQRAPGDPDVVAWYGQARSPGMPDYQDLPPAAKQQVASAYRSVTVDQLTNVQPGDLLNLFPFITVPQVAAGAAQTFAPGVYGPLHETYQQALYGLGRHTKDPNSATDVSDPESMAAATPEQRQRAIASGQQLIAFLSQQPAGLAEGLAGLRDVAGRGIEAASPGGVGQALGAGAAEGMQGYASEARRAEVPTRLAPRPLQLPPPEMDLTTGALGQSIAERTGSPPVHYQITDKAGKALGDVVLTIDPDGVASVQYARGARDTITQADMPRLAAELQSLHPEITTFRQPGLPLPGWHGPAGPGPSLWHETSPLDAGTFVDRLNTADTTFSSTFLASHPDLALGQAGKGVLIEFDKNRLMDAQHARLNEVNKPGLALTRGQGITEYEARLIPQEIYQNAVKSITVKPDATGSRGFMARLRTVMAELPEAKGWTKETLPDGSVKVSRPAGALSVRERPGGAAQGLPSAVAGPQTTVRGAGEATDRLAGQRGAVNTDVLGKGLAVALKPFGVGGRVQRASDMARTLSQFPPEAAQQLAFHNVTRLSGELSDIQATGLQPITDLRQREQALRSQAETLNTAGRTDQGSRLSAAADGLAQQAEKATATWQKAVQDKTNEIGKYEAAATDVMDGRKHPVTPWSDQIANEIHEKIGFSEKDLPPSDASGFMLARSEANMLLKKARGLQTSVNNLSTGWSRALTKALPHKADRVKVLYELEPKRVGETATLHTPLEAGNIPGKTGGESPPISPETAIEHVVPPVIQKIMDEEYAVPGAANYHLNEEQAYQAAQQRGLWPPPEAGVRPDEALAGGPPPLGTITGHQVRATEPPPVEITPEIRAAAGAIRALLTRVGLHLVDNAHLISALRADFYPHIFLKGPNGENAAQAMEMALNPGRRHPLNPDAPTFHRRFLEETLPSLQGQGYHVVDDPARVVPLYLRSVARALSNQMVTTYIKDAIVRPGQDGRPAFVPGEQGRVPETSFDLKGYKFLNTDELRGYLHPDVYNALRWQLESPVVKNPALKALLKFQQMDRQVVMFNPLFHGENQLSHHLMTSAVPGRLALLGRALSQDPAIMRDAAQWAHLTPSRSAMDDMVDVVHGVMPEVPEPGNILGRLNDWRHQVLWEGMVRNAQVAAFVLERERLMQRGFSREDASAGGGVYADRIVGAQDPATKLAWERVGSRYFMFAYNWTKTHVMQVAESVPFGIGQRVLTKENPFLSPEVASQLSHDLLTSSLRGVSSALVYTQMLNLMLTSLNGNPHLTFFNDKGREWQLDVTGVAKLMGIPTGGQNVYWGSPFMRFPDWYRQYADDIQRANGGRGALGSGSLQFFKNKLMAPFPQVWDQIANAESGGHQWGDWERVRNLLLGIGGQQGILPTTVVGTPAAIGAAGRELLPHGATDLLDPAGVWGRIVNPGVQVGRQELGLLGRALGGQVPSYGPRPDIGQVLDPQQQRAVDLYLATNGISPVKATVAQRDEAITATSKEILSQATSREQAFKATEKQAVLDMMRQHPEHLNGQTPEAAYQSAIDNGRSPFDELNNAQKSEIFKQHPELELFHQVASGAADPAQREVLRQSTAYRVALQDQIDQERQVQRQDDQLFQQGQLTEQAWRDRRSRRLQELYGQNGAVTALKDAYPQALVTTDDWNAYYQQHGQAPKGLTPEDTAYQAYRAVNLDDPKYQMPDGSPDVIRWWADRQQILRGLPSDQQDYIHTRESADRTPLENLYSQAQNKYLAFEAQNAPGAAAYHNLYQTTSSLQEQKLLRASDPALQNYIIQRRLFLLQNPAVAFFVSGGRTVSRALGAAGISPLTNSAEQLQQLQQGGFVQELGATNPDLFAGQVGSLTPGG